MKQYRYETDLRGKTFGHWVVLRRTSDNPKFWICRCSCSNQTVRRIECYSLMDGNTTCCAEEGCEHIPYRIHGQWKHRLYKVWDGMMQRCYNKKCDSYPEYGGRGIRVCKRWANRETGFLAFLKDMEIDFTEGLQLDRYPDTNGHYKPSNCRWATPRENTNNRRKTVFLIIDGVQYPATMAAEKFNIGVKTILFRKRLGWSDEDCITPPYQKRTELDRSLGRNKAKGQKNENPSQ